MAQSRLMLVEGTDDKHVVYNLSEKNRFYPEFEVSQEGGVPKLLKEFGIRLKVKEPGLERLGLLIDADDQLGTKWNSVKAILIKAGFSSVPSEPDSNGTVIEPPNAFLPRVGIWLMPDNVRPGMLEDFLIELVPPEDSLWKYTQTVVDGIPATDRRFREQHLIKAYVHTWLAWQEQPGIPMGKAIGLGFFASTNPLVVRFLVWLTRLYG